MPDWLRDAIANGETLPSWEVLTMRVALSLVTGFVVAGVFATTLGRRRDDVRTMATTLILLCVLIAVVTLVIGNSVARAFGLVGALSIVRFRTVVEDTRDTAFVIFAVAVGMGIGAGHAMLTLIAIPAVWLAALIMSYFDRPRPGAKVSITIRLGLGIDPSPIIPEILARYLDQTRLSSTGTAKQGTAFEVTYVGWLRVLPTSVALLAELNKVEGVQAVEMK